MTTGLTAAARRTLIAGRDRHSGELTITCRECDVTECMELYYDSVADLRDAIAEGRCNDHECVGIVARGESWRPEERA